MDISNFAIGAGSLSIAGSDIGGTTEKGVVVSVEPNIHLHTSGKYGKTPVKATYLGINLTLVVEMAEATLANLNKVIGGSHLVGSKVQFGGVAGVEVVGKELIITPFDGSEAWTFKNAVPTGSVEVEYSTTNERIFKVTFTAMVDSTEAENENVANFS